MKLIYITENINAVFYSQVVELLNNIADKNYFEKIYLCIGLRNPEKLESIDGLDKSIKLKTFKTYPMYPTLNTMTKHSLFKLFNSLHVDKNFIIHTRIEFLGSLAYKSYMELNSEKPNLLVDIRGAVIEEIQNYGKIHPLLKLFKLSNYKFLIQKVLSNTAYINTVSNELKEYIQKHYYVDEKIISVIPTIAGKNFNYSEEKRNVTREKLGVKSNEVLFVFSSGSSQAWQNDDAIVDELTSQGYKVLMLTKKKYTNPNVISRFVPYLEVSDYLNASDVGIIIRNDDIVNNVASPIKFSEYISCGLPVISNKSVGIITDTITKNECGKLVNLLDITPELVEKIVVLDRNRISKIGIDYFGINHITNQYMAIYKKIKDNLNE